jgi:ParB family chromosome partitioning protein
MAKKPDSAPPKKAPKKEQSAAVDSARKVVAKQRGLGRGLSSLLGDAGAAASMASSQPAGDTPPPAAPLTGLVEIPIEWINSGPWQPRRRFEIGALEELADSIRSKGLVQPILLRPHASKANRYELIAGERRWRAAQMAQLHKVPAIIRDFGDEEAYEVALIENVQRADLNVIEEGDGYRQLIENFGYTQGQLSEIIGKSRSHIANLMRLLTLPEDVCNQVIDGNLTMGQVRPLIGHDDASTLAREIVRRGLNARQVEALVARPRSGSATRPAAATKSADIHALEAKAEKTLGVKMDIVWNDARDSGKMSLSFSKLEQLEDVLKKLGIS